MSPILQRALAILEQNGIGLEDLPDDRDDQDWNVIRREADLGPLELVALKSLKQRKNIFSEGLPEMRPLSDTSNFTSNPSIPSEARHPAAEVIISDFQCLAGLGDLPHPVTNIWNQITPQTGILGGYSTEADVNDYAKKVIVDILESLRLRDVVTLRYEVEVMRNRPDFILILANGQPIGTIQGKEPGKDAMCHANILGEVYVQLMHLRSIFRIDTPFSILTCYEQ